MGLNFNSYTLLTINWFLYDMAYIYLCIYCIYIIYVCIYIYMHIIHISVYIIIIIIFRHTSVSFILRCWILWKKEKKIFEWWRNYLAGRWRCRYIYLWSCSIKWHCANVSNCNRKNWRDCSKNMQWIYSKFFFWENVLEYHQKFWFTWIHYSMCFRCLCEWTSSKQNLVQNSGKDTRKMFNNCCTVTVLTIILKSLIVQV